MASRAQRRAAIEHAAALVRSGYPGAARYITTKESYPMSAPVLASEVTFNEGVLRLAAVHDREVVFRYAKGSGKHIETRTFVPTSVAKNKKGEVYFTGPDPDRDGEPRAYRLDRIKGDVDFT